jgi:hypothetical protein
MPLPTPTSIRRAADILCMAAFAIWITLPFPLVRPGFTWPDWRPLHTLADRFNLEVATHIGFRDALIRTHNSLCCALLGFSPSVSVVLGKDGWLFYDGHPLVEDASPVRDFRGRHPLPIGQLERLRWAYEDQYLWLREQGIRYLLVLIPSKPMIYPEHMTGSRRPGATTWRQQFTGYLRAHTEVPVLDTTEAILAAKARGPVFLPADSHWSHLGMFAGYTAILEALAAGDPRFSPLPAEAFDVQVATRRGGDLAALMNLEDAYVAQEVRMVPRARPRATLTPLSEDEHAVVVGGTGDPAQPTAVVYRDSFADELLPLLAEHFREVEFVWWRAGGAWRYSDGWQMAGIEEKQPDYVLHILSDRILERPIPYAPRIRHRALEARFTNATRTAYALAADGVSGLRAGRHATVVEDQGGWAVDARGPGARLVLPRLPDLDTHLPILRIAIRPPRHSILQLIEPAPPERFWRSEQERSLSRDALEQGTNVHYIPVVDPEVRQPLQLDLGPVAGRYRIVDLEIRCYPRDAPPGP